MDFSSFLTSLLTSFLIFVLLMLIFSWLSRNPQNSVVYYPNRLLRGLEPFEGRKGTRNPLSWIFEAIRATEAEVVAAAGVDATAYLLFLGSVLAILVLSGIVLLPVLLPVAATDRGGSDTTSLGSFNNLDKFAMGNVHPESKRLWAFMLAVYVVSIITYYILWRTYKHVSNLRAAAKSSPDLKPDEFTVLVRDIPPPPSGKTIKEHIDSYFKALHADTFYKSIVITNNTEANKIWDEIEGYRKKIARTQVVYEESKTVNKPEGVRPSTRTGFLGLIGEKVDTIDYCKKKINELLRKLEEEQKITTTEKQQAAALVVFNCRLAAISASQTIHAQLLDTWTVMEAPEPRELIWTNLPIKLYDRQIRSLLVYGLVFLTIFFYMIPIAFVSAFTSLENLEKLLPFLKPVVEFSAVKTVLEAFLPQLALMVFMALLPMFLMFLSKAEGIPSESHAERAASGKYFYFVVLNVFIGVTLGGTLISSLKKIIKRPGDLITLLGTSLPPNATFFMTYVALQFFVGYGLELSRLVPLIIFHLKKKYLCKTEDELKDAWAPGDFGYATRVPNDMLIMTIVLCYSVIAPLIIPFGVAYFGLGWLISRNQALKVYVPKYESNGRMWPHMHTRILASLIIYQITMLGYIGLLRRFIYAPALVPLIVFSFIFAIICKNRFYKAFAYTPLEVAARDTRTPNVEAVYEAYIPPCLKLHKHGEEDEFEDADSRSLRTTSM